MCKDRDCITSSLVGCPHCGKTFSCIQFGFPLFKFVPVVCRSLTIHYCEKVLYIYIYLYLLLRGNRRLLPPAHKVFSSAHWTSPPTSVSPNRMTTPAPEHLGGPSDLPSVSWCLSCIGGPKLDAVAWIQYSVWQVRKKNCILNLLAVLLIWPRVLLAFFAAKVHCRLIPSSFSAWIPWSAELIPSPSVPSLYHYRCLSFPVARLCLCPYWISCVAIPPDSLYPSEWKSCPHSFKLFPPTSCHLKTSWLLSPSLPPGHR